MNKKNEYNNKSEKLLPSNLSKFHLQTYSGTPAGKIFANGKMQCGLKIIILATDDNNRIVKLTDEELDSIELINMATGEKLSGEWSYSDVENDYTHLYPSPYLEQSSQFSNSLPQYTDLDQKKIYWVTSKQIAELTIGAKFILNKKTFKSPKGILIKAERPIIYSKEDIYKYSETSIKSGKYKIHEHVDKRTINGHETSDKDFYFPWNQTNHYYRIKYLIHDITIWNTREDKNKESPEYHKMAHLKYYANLHIWFLWGDFQDERTAGDIIDSTYKYEEPLGNGMRTTTYTTRPQAEITTTNDEAKGLISFSELWFEANMKELWKETPEKENTANLKFHDEYGNESRTLRVEIKIEDGQQIITFENNI
ncbi:hypothetical protein [Xenorhabdus sp. PB30.3]|uniref:hypothetical protein n=1 Tax=Xenorhabdus sp. PB30.3 TaxID=2788941 RepID=UPI001E4157A5|nr:hypothetical protein [Xenorhabdus sp. PB30.3]MCC8378571.1 hypothetical protein [Xenorhabdus sp. PB30.3]